MKAAPGSRSWQGPGKTARDGDFPELLALDRAATGEDRRLLLSSMARGAQVVRRTTGGLDGAYLPELGTGAVMARTEKAGRALLRAKLGTSGGRIVVPEENAAALGFLTGMGYRESLRYPRMVLGPEPPWNPAWIWSRGSGWGG